MFKQADSTSFIFNYFFRVWMRVMFLSGREVGLDRHAAFWKWFVGFIKHFVGIYEGRYGSLKLHIYFVLAKITTMNNYFHLFIPGPLRMRLRRRTGLGTRLTLPSTSTSTTRRWSTSSELGETSSNYQNNLSPSYLES
jgi:hypothetical protein